MELGGGGDMYSHWIRTELLVSGTGQSVDRFAGSGRDDGARKALRESAEKEVDYCRCCCCCRCRCGCACDSLAVALCCGALRSKGSSSSDCQNSSQSEEVSSQHGDRAIAPNHKG
jgi:hypothetical protein